MAVTPNMGLVKWSNLNDPYDHSQLAGNFDAIDAHDHTLDNGVQIPTEGIEDLAITTAKLADGSVTAIKLADGAVTVGKIASGVINSLGDLKWWWRPNELTSVPTGGWVIAEGQVLSSSEHDFPGGGSITLPNLIEKFVLGAQLANVGVSGGQSSYNFSHSHNVNAHTHGVAPHSHTISLESGFGAETNLKVSQDLSGSAWVHSDNNSGAKHRHSINGSVNVTGVTTEAATSTTDSRLTSVTIIPPNVGFLPLIKVKNS